MKPVPPSVKPRVLVAPLDWGLGHAARCIPVIRALLTSGAAVWLAADGGIAAMLATEFPNLPLLPLPGYGVRYGKTRAGTLALLLRQLPKLQRAIAHEHQWLQTAVATYGFDVVVSDNRYGLHHPAVHSVFITHQLRVKTLLRATDALLQGFLYSHINRFDACWVPDAEGPQNLAGALAHPKKLPQVPVTYVGPLSRFAPQPPVLLHYVLVLLSGPEPQRTVLENLVLAQAQLFQMPMLVVRGLPGHAGLPPVPYHITIVNHLPAATLQKAIDAATFVISRCGYSTVMDMMTLQKQCIFIPTPMQTEQEYLAKRLLRQNRALTIAQHKFQLKAALTLAASFPYTVPQLAPTTLHEAVQALLAAVSPIEQRT